MERNLGLLPPANWLKGISIPRKYFYAKTVNYHLKNATPHKKRLEKPTIPLWVNTLPTTLQATEK